MIKKFSIPMIVYKNIPEREKERKNGSEKSRGAKLIGISLS